MLKNKKATLIVGAIVFLVVIFFLKSGSSYKSTASQQAMLAYGNLPVQDLVSKDTDGDGVPDWQENLMGTDPTKKETTAGIPDKVAIQKIEDSNKDNSVDISGGTTGSSGKLTQTDKFSQELFTTVATLNQTGPVDQTTVDKISASLVDRIKNYSVKKIYSASDLNISSDNSLTTVKNYNNKMGVINNAYPIINPADVLKAAITESGDFDSSVLSQLNPYTKQTQGIINGMLKIKVPQEFAQAHLNVINAFEKVTENLSDVQLIDTDSVVALGATSQYDDNNTALDSAIFNLKTIIWKKLKS